MTLQLVPGLTIGKLTIIEEKPYRSHGDRVWTASCSCGAVLEDTACHMRNRSSCGSHACRKTRSDSNGGFAPHDKSKRIPEYMTWCDIKKRCSNPKHISFQFYGARGIFVCDRWLHSFPSFLSDMGRRPSKDHSIERIYNNGPYSPDNCKWATRREQGRNKRNNVWIEYGGRRMILADWSRETGLPRNLLYSRKKLGWDDEKILTTVPTPNGRRKGHLSLRLPNGVSVEMPPSAAP